MIKLIHSAANFNRVKVYFVHMYLFLTENKESWTGIFYAVDDKTLVDLEDRTDHSFKGRGILTDNVAIIVSTNGMHPTHYIVTDREMIEAFQKAVSLFQDGGIPILRAYGNTITARLSDVTWANYILHVAYDNE